MLDETPLAPLGLAGLVFMASGQGSQKPGMGADMLDIPEVTSVFACASDVLGRDVAALVRDASPEELNDTRNAQIAIAALSVGMGRALEARGIVPDALLGFSLGQVSAMVLGGMLANLVKRIDRSAPRAAIQDRPSFDAFVEEFGKE